jgi:hypothetical protein
VLRDRSIGFGIECNQTFDLTPRVILNVVVNEILNTRLERQIHDVKEYLLDAR